MGITTKQELALEYFSNGFNCAQAVVSVFCKDYGIDTEIALRLAGGLGGGVRAGEICGAVSGAVMVIGARYGQYIASDKDSRRKCYSETTQFIENMKAGSSSIVCRELLGFDVSTPEGRQAQADNPDYRKTCNDMIKKAVTLLENMGL